MSPVRILVMYNGDWTFNENGFEYSGGKLKGIVVDEKITHNDLLDRVCSIVKVDLTEFAVTMKCLYKAHVPTPPTEILDNDDVEFFLGENLVEDHGRRTPLCLTIKQKESLNQGKEMQYPAPFDSGSVSNQTSGFAPTAQQSQFPTFLPLTEIEEQNTAALNCVPLGDVNCDNGLQNVDQHGDCNEDRMVDNEAEDGHMQNDNFGSNGEIHQDTENNNMAFDCRAVQNGRKNIDEFSTPEQLNLGIQEPCLYSEQLSVINFPKNLTPNVPKNVTPNVPKNVIVEASMSDDIIAVGQFYRSKKDVQSKLSLIAIRDNFEFKVSRSTRERLYIVCGDKTCKWLLRASRMVNSDKFLIRKFHNVHTCLRENSERNHHHASSWFVGQLVKSKFEEGATDYRPNDIIKDVEKQFGVTISYEKAWRAREIALLSINGSTSREKRSRGRPRKEKTVVITSEKEPCLRFCGTCGGTGHNRKTCRTLISMHSEDVVLELGVVEKESS